MCKRLAIAITLLAASPLCSATSSYVVPTTTLAALTSNNTSAANNFATQSNHNRGAGNISKVDIHTLLYPGATTKIYAHMLLWFGPGSGHMNIGYSSTSAAQVKSQIDDMVSRGIDGVVIDWYGQNNSIDQATQLVMAQAESHPGFTFAIMIDQGAIQWYSCPGCSPQQALVSDLQYIEHTYFSSPAYMTIQGKPMVTNFAIDQSYTIDWNAAAGAMSTQPAFIFQNNSGFSHVLSDGGYSWVIPTSSDYGMSYLTSFYDTGLSTPNEQTIGASYKGFNDTLASWSMNRVMGQQCGQTWLQTFGKLNSMYNAGKPLPYLQLVTWNDYEEATEIESGIDNCLTLSASVTANSLQWSVQGSESTVDHYAVYISSDGQNLMPLTDLATGIHSLNLCGFPIPNSSYQLFVQAVGKPTIANQITSAASYTATCTPIAPPPIPPTPTPTPPPTPTPTLSFSASPASLTISAGTSGNLTVSAKMQSGSFNSLISLSCNGLSSSLSCSFYPATINPGSGTATSTLTISARTAAGTNQPPHRKPIPLYGSWLLPLGLVGFGFLGKGPGKRGAQLVALCAVLGLGMFSASCGSTRTVGAANASVAVPAATASYAVTINGSSSASQLSTTVNVIVQ
jgi:hypothetical protein